MVVILISFPLSLFAQKPAYVLFREDGKKVKYEKMVEAASGADVVLFGELHNNPIAHWLQLELTRDLHDNRGEDLVLGAEMFEADNQLIMDEYMSGLISEAKFEEEARLWKNYKTDYKPLVLFAKEHDLMFVATNIPRRYANSVLKQGISVLDSLSEEAEAFIAPLPIKYDTSLNCYNRLIHGGEMTGRPGSINLADAQAVKDATMTHFIQENWKPGRLFIHYNGAYHSDHFESMNWFLHRNNQKLKIVTISTVSQDVPDELEEGSMGKADFIIAVPSSMTKTH
ncbi:MAG: ChaN family lipoprotein [Bacteroidales bacterium]|nr:ChaN family lipoprotein [Bacteroidales bacterium]